MSRVDRVRVRVARAVRLVFLLLAALLAIGAVLVALRHNINEANPLVRFLSRVDDAIDGPFSRQDGVFAFSGAGAATKEALVNWGVAAIVYLLIGRVLERVVRP